MRELICLLGCLFMCNIPAHSQAMSIVDSLKSDMHNGDNQSRKFQQFDYRYFTVSELGQDQGLSQGSNYFRYEDEMGFMWITANDGINRWDGRNIKVFNKKKDFNDCPVLRQGYNIVEDSNHNIYIGSTNGLYVYQRDKDSFVCINPFDSASTIVIPFAFHEGLIWVYNNNYQIAAYSPITGKWKHYPGPKLQPMTGTHAYSLGLGSFFYKKSFIDRHNTIWLADNECLASYDYSTNTSKFYCLPELLNSSQTANKKETRAPTGIQCFTYRASDETILLGTNSGMIHFDMKTKNTAYIPEIDGEDLRWVREIAVFQNDFLCMSRRGLMLYNTENNTALWFKEQVSELVFSFNPLNVGVDKTNRIWLCKIGEGFQIIDFTPTTFFKETHRSDRTGFLQKGRVMGITELPNHNIMMAVGNIKMIRDVNTREINPIVKDNTQDGYNDILVSDPFRNVIWQCGYNKLNYYNPVTAQTINIDVESRNDEPVTIKYHIAPISAEEILLAGKGGLYNFDVHANVFKPIKNLPDKLAFYINPISKDRYLISYLNDDMLLVQKNGDASYTAVKTILPGVFSFYVWEDTLKNQFWIAGNQGIYIVDAEWNIVKIIDENEGLAGSYIYGILSDDIGNIWVSHGRGISSINKTNFTITNYGKEDGIQDWDFNNRSFFKSSNGTLYFGGINGFNYFKPPVKVPELYKPKVYVNEINHHNAPYLSNTNSDWIHHIKLPSGIQNLSINAMISNLGFNTAYKIMYRIKGEDSEWVYDDNPTTIFLYSLAPGTYTLQLGVYNKYDKTEEIQKEITIEIVPYFYQTVWFWILLGMGISYVIFRIISKRKLSIQKRKYEQQLALEKEKNRISKDLHDDVGATISSLGIYSELAGKLVSENTDNTKEILDKIKLQSNDLMERMSDIVWSLKSPYEEKNTLTVKLKNFSQELFSGKDIHTIYNIDESLMQNISEPEIRKNILLIFREAMNNITKYSNASNIQLTLTSNNENIIINIKDDGIGFNPLTVKNGNGLDNIRQRCRQMGGSAVISSTPDLGTEIYCTLPNSKY